MASDVGPTQFVVIDEVQPPDPRLSERHGNRRPHGSTSKNRDRRGHQKLRTRIVSTAVYPRRVRPLGLVAKDLCRAEVSAREHLIREVRRPETIEKRCGRASPAATWVPRRRYRDADDPGPETSFSRKHHDEVVLTLGHEVGEKSGHVATAPLG